MERIENLARILDVNETYNRGRAGDNDWSRILRLQRVSDLLCICDLVHAS